MTTACPAAKAALASAATIGTYSWDQILPACTVLFVLLGGTYNIDRTRHNPDNRRCMNLWHIGMTALCIWHAAADSAAQHPSAGEHTEAAPSMKQQLQ